MFSRRGFLNAMIGSSAALAMQGSQRAGAQANRRMIVDAQVSLWRTS